MEESLVTTVLPTPIPLETQTTMTLSPQGEDSLQRCVICSELLNVPRPDGSTETPSMLPCSHIFGNLCISRWLSTSKHQDCPTCRRSMLYTMCRHLIEPWDAARAPKPLKDQDMPEKCLVCASDGEVRNQARMLVERLVAEETALKGLKMVLPGVFGSLCRNTVSSVEERVAASREAYLRGMEELSKGLLEKREEW